jgi:hypothetical protein
MRAAFSIAAANVLAICTAAPSAGNGTDTTQVAPRYVYEQAMALGVSAITEGIAAAQAGARVARLLRWVKP